MFLQFSPARSLYRVFNGYLFLMTLSWHVDRMTREDFVVFCQSRFDPWFLPYKLHHGVVHGILLGSSVHPNAGIQRHVNYFMKFMTISHISIGCLFGFFASDFKLRRTCTFLLALQEPILNSDYDNHVRKAWTLDLNSPLRIPGHRWLSWMFLNSHLATTSMEQSPF